MRRPLFALGVAATLASMLMPAGVALAARQRAEAPQMPNSTRALYLSLIRQARVDGRTRAALAYLDDFDRQHPGDADAAVLRVNCLLDLGQIDAARSALSRLPGGDRDGNALEVRGHVFAAQGRWEEAAAQYTAARQASPADPSIGNALGFAQLRIGRIAEAIETLRGAADLAPGDTVVRNNLALALTVAGRRDEAVKLLAKIPDATERARLTARLTTEAARLLSPPLPPPLPPLASSQGGSAPHPQ